MQVKKMRRRYRQVEQKFSLKERLVFVESLYSAWLHREKLRFTFPIEKLDGNVEVMSELTGQTFKNNSDMKKKVRAWIKEMSELLLDKKAKRDSI